MDHDEDHDPRPDGEEPPKRRAGVVLSMAAALAVVAALVLTATTMLGRSSSSKFESVAMAICDTRLPGGDASSWRREPRSPLGALGPLDLPEPGVVGGAAVDEVGGVVAGDALSGVIGGGGEVQGAQAPCGGGYVPAAGAASAAGSSGSPSGAGAPSATPPVTAPPLAPGQTSFGANALDAGTAAASTASAADDSAPTSPGPAAAGHAFVSTATMTVMVAGDTAKDVAEQKRRALAIAASAGGGLFGEQSAFDGEARATVTLKVPSGQFTKVLEDLAGLGTIKAQEVKTDEVTLQVIDLQARITAATNGLDRTRGLLAKATNLGDVAQLEADVNRRQTEVENLRGQQAALAQRVELSTVVLTLVSSAPVAAPPPPPVVAAPAPLPGFLDGLEKGWGAFTKAGSVGLAGVGVVLPFLPLLLAAFVAWRLLRRRKFLVHRGTSATT